MTQIPTLKTEFFSAQNMVHLKQKAFQAFIILTTPHCVFYYKDLSTSQQNNKDSDLQNFQDIFFTIHEGTFFITNALGAEEYQDFLEQQQKNCEVIKKPSLNLENSSPEELIRHIGDSLFQKSREHAKFPQKAKKEKNIEGLPAEILSKRQEIDQLLKQLDDPCIDQSQEDKLVKKIDTLKAEIHHLLRSKS
ncbi:hypothetical protein NEF87_003901 [Candidatus Lokiarchaeum ossiferum]|uniref:Uncharacterized protein n=1 Tax=Candidatus Lokiarchaeum ossiferum TaxID=2951803 RepID=A0ABY6HW52_9ARCH|nr:hypothetical protein NEF87_003901 [Candidatus Lokiarchaeum sp. B-35]